MALRFPAKKVAFDIVAGGAEAPVVVEHDGWKILRVTYDQLDDYETCKGAMRQLSRLLHGESPAQDDWEEGGRRLNAYAMARSA